MRQKAEYTFFFEGCMKPKEDGKLYIFHIDSEQVQDSLLKHGEYYASVYYDIFRHRQAYSAMVRAANYTEALNILNSNLYDTEIILQVKPLYNLKQPYEDPNGD